MGKPVVIQVIGYQNSGKTTVICQLIERLKRAGITSGVIKHHGHSNDLNPSDEGKDTMKYRQSGASISAVVDEYSSLITYSLPIKLEQAIRIYRELGADVVFIEGYKNQTYSRIVLLKDNEDEALAENDEKILFQLVWPDYLGKRSKRAPVFALTESGQWQSHILDWLRKELELQ